MLRGAIRNASAVYHEERAERFHDFASRIRFHDNVVIKTSTKALSVYGMASCVCVAQYYGQWVCHSFHGHSFLHSMAHEHLARLACTRCAFFGGFRLGDKQNGYLVCTGGRLGLPNSMTGVIGECAERNTRVSQTDPRKQYNGKVP